MPLILAFLVSLVFAFSLMISLKVALLFLVGLCGMLIFSGTPLRALFLLIFIIPFSGTEVVGVALLPGLKIINLLFIFLVMVAAFHRRQAMPMSRPFLVFCGTIVLLMTVGIFRAMPYMNALSYAWQEEVSITRLILSYLMKPLIYLMPLVIIAKYVKDAEDVENIIIAITLSMITLSSFLFLFYVFKVPNKTDFDAVRWAFTGVLNIHGNGLVNFYIMAYPILLARFILRKDAISIMGVLTATPIFGLLYSRTGYALLFFSVIFYCWISKKTRYLPAIIAIVVVLFLGVAFKTIKERAATGLERNDTYQLSGGRIQGVWEPLIEEYVRDPKKLMVGNGRYGTVTSKAYRNRIINVGHPHNMYLEQVTDGGLIALALVLVTFSFMLKKIISNMRKIDIPALKEYQYATLTSVLAFLISGITGRSFFPDLDCAYFWIALGISAAIVRLSKGEAHERTI